MSWKQTVVWLFLRNTTIGRNYLGTSEEALRQRMGKVALRGYQQALTRQAARQKGADVQYLDDDFRVMVRNGYSWSTNSYTTEIFVYDRNPAVHLHLHIVYDESGKELVNEWRNDKIKG